MRRVQAISAVVSLAALTAGAPAQGNAALGFNVNDYVRIPSSPSLNFSITSAITVEAWTRLTAVTSLPTVLRRDLGPIPSGEMYLLRVNNVYSGIMELAFYLRIANVSTLVLGIVPASLNAWHHFAGTYDGATMRIYWDGQLVALQAATGGIATSLSDLRIGAGDLTDGWVGQLDEVRLWSLARTEAEIQGYLHSTVVGNELGLRGCWRFDAGTGQIAADCSAYGNHGQLGSVPTPDLNDPSWTTVAAPLDVAVTSLSPPFGPAYASTPVTITGHGFMPGATTVSVGGQILAGAIVANALTINASVPAGPVGTVDVSVSAPYGSDALSGGWTWADALHVTGGISAAAGGSADFSLFAGPSSALRLYLVATSVSGTSPGLPLPGTGLVLPLNPDVWTEIALSQVNTPALADFLGILDAQGQGNASFNVSPGILPPAVVGLPIRFAYVVLQPFPGGFATASNPVTVTVGP